MKKEILNLLNQDSARLDINSLFYLTRERVTRENDMLNRDIDNLYLNMNTRYQSMTEIKSRDFAGVQKEIREAMEKMIDNYKNDLLRRFDGGQISKNL